MSHDCHCSDVEDDDDEIDQICLLRISYLLPIAIRSFFVNFVSRVAMVNVKVGLKVWSLAIALLT